MLWLLGLALEKVRQYLKKLNFFFAQTQLVSLLIVGFGQPAVWPLLAPLASSVGLALHWRGLDYLSDRIARKISFFWFFVVQLIQLSWMSAIEYQGPFFLLVYIGLSLALGWQFSFLTFQMRKVSFLSFGSIFMLSAIWVCMEWCRHYFFCGFTFNFLGVFLSWSVFSLQLASLFGVLGLSFFVVFTNLCGLRLLRGKFLWSSTITFFCILLLPYIYGGSSMFLQDFFAKGKKEGEYSLLLIQTGLTPSQKYPIYKRSAEFLPALEQWSVILGELVKHVGKKLDLVVFPEAVVPFGFGQRVYEKSDVKALCVSYFGSAINDSFPLDSFSKVSNAYFFQTLARFFQVEFVAGLDYEEGGLYYNSVFSFSPSSDILKRYDKRILLPIAESLPFSFLKSVSKIYGIDQFFTPGTSAQVFGEISWAPSICYEEMFPFLMRESKRLGANLFVNLTNDAWYPSSSLSVQHFTQGLIRAVENGVPLIRASNKGITAAVDSLGRIVSFIEGEEANSLYVKISKHHYRTFFSSGGAYLFIVFCVVLSLSFLCLSRRRVFKACLPSLLSRSFRLNCK